MHTVIVTDDEMFRWHGKGLQHPSQVACAITGTHWSGPAFFGLRQEACSMSRVRCAIYTRKSSDEGLEQDFNCLDAQREACAAYILSQASEGWVLCPDALR